MKCLFAGDLHGSSYYTKKMLAVAKVEKVDKIILLGDIYNHGPRNGLSLEYDPMSVSDLLNEQKDLIECVKGNCDSEVDETISEFKIVRTLQKDINGKRFFFSHGHIYNDERFPSETFDVLVYGHFHIPCLKEENGKQFLCVGSVGVPKGGSKNCCVIVDENGIFFRDLV